jgi:beta-mannosidase
MRATGGPRRQLLRQQWFLAAMDPGAALAPADLTGANWMAIPGPMPAAAALRSLGQWSLDGPVRDFDAQDWWFRAVFDAAGLDDATLGLDGLATLSQVWLNGTGLLSGTNMFVEHRCEVGPLLRAKGNELLIRCAALDAELKLRRPRPRWRTPMVANQQLRWLRTTLLGRTPGWSPPAAVVGPWKDVWLSPHGEAPVRDVQVDARVEDGAGVVQCRLELSPGTFAVREAGLRLQRDGRTWVQRLEWDERARAFTGQLRIAQPELWWPSTHGEPALYGAGLAIEGAPGMAPVHVDLGRVGFRSIEVDTQGGGFALRVNGVPVFCRGAVWTPLDPVMLRSSAPEYEAAVAQARAAGMNMLRVPGTGVYEDDAFYAACDAAGVLVWQDFMFANMDYPAGDEAFLASATLEARQQLQRLAGHPCLAVLCGNSEAQQQAAMWGAPREHWESPLFAQTLPRLCAELAPRTPYWRSSAWGGAFPHQANTGTTSYYGVGAYLRPLDDARMSGLRFATECLAFANIPAQSALARMPGGLATRAHHPQWKQRSPRDLGAGWDFDDVRDHYLSLVFGTDAQQLRSRDHDRYLALGRAATGEAMAAAFGQWRRPGSGCGGALVLMLRDLWPGAGWGLVDDAGVPKACYHALKRALQPVTVVLADEGMSGLVAHVINETAQALDLRLELSAWRGDARIASGTASLHIGARTAHTVAAVDLLDHFMDLNYAYRFGPPACDVVCCTLTDANGAHLARAFHFPQPPGSEPEPDVGLAARMAVLDAHTAELTISARRLALGVHFEFPCVTADDEFFHLPPGGEVKILLRGADAAPGAGWVHALNSRRSTRVAPEAARETR